MRRSGGVAGLPVLAVALDDRGQVLSRDTMPVVMDVHLPAAFDRLRLRRLEGLGGGPPGAGARLRRGPRLGGAPGTGARL
jgi:hypothetical protein